MNIFANKIIVAIYLAFISLSVTAETVLNNNGAWCWYQDERVIVSGNMLVVSSVANRLGEDGADRGGNVEVTIYNLNQKSSPTVNILHKNLENDDHNAPALLKLPTENLLAVYSRHGRDRKIRYRITSSNTNLGEWQKEVAMQRKDKTTYANLMHLSDENKGKGRIYNFYRGINYNPSFDTSNDNGKTWSEGQHFIKNEGRPYVKYISNNKDEIHFITTEQHPRVFDNSIYHGYLKAGKIYRSDGTFIQNINDGPVTTAQLTRIYQGGPDNVAWTTDLHLDKQGNPFAVFSVQVGDANTRLWEGKLHERWKGDLHGDDMRYFYAKWQQPSWWKFGAKKGWQVNEIAYAGSRLYSREQDYTGLVALNPQNPGELVISTNANPDTGEPLISQADGKRHWELFKGITEDEGKTWSWYYLTKDSIEDNLRPIIPINNKDELLLLWMKGYYSSYKEMNTRIVFELNPRSLSRL